MTSERYAHIVIYVGKNMPATSLSLLKSEIGRIADSYSPKIPVEVKKEWQE